MQVKVVIGTIAFMLTMIILGFAALREPTRLEKFTRAFEGRSIETGADLYDNNCAACHGVQGKAEECVDVAGNVAACQGAPLNSAPLLCGDKSLRMEALGWEGSKRAFIETTIAAGRFGTVMPTWSADFGGPMRDDQIQNLAAFILNWGAEGGVLCATPVVTFEWPETADDFLAEYEGNAANGESLFAVPYSCSACHGNPDGSVPAAVGPDLSNIAETGATRIGGYTAAQYLYESILDPNAFVAEECPTGPCISPSAMASGNFDLRMGENPQDLADIMAYLLQER